MNEGEAGGTWERAKSESKEMKTTGEREGGRRGKRGRERLRNCAAVGEY